MTLPRAILLVCAAALLASLAASAAWFRAHLPPDCSDPRTVALVRRSLVSRYHLPPDTTLQDIRTVAGGMLALRFVCRADAAGFNPQDLPPGMPLPGTIRYTSRLTADRSQHEVTVELQPLLNWENAQ